AFAVAWLLLTFPLWIRVVFARRARVVTIRLQGAVAEDASPQSWLRRLLVRDERLTFMEALAALEHVERDARVEIVVLDLDRAQLSLVHADELAQVVSRLRKQGKRVLAWIDDARGPDLRLAAAASVAIAPPGGMIGFQGVRARVPFLKGGLEQAGVVGDLEHVGPWKTMSDTFTRRDFTPEHRAMVEGITHDLHEAIVAPVVLARGLDRAAIDAALADSPIDNVAAVSRKLLDRTRFRDEIEDELRALLGLEKDARLPRSAQAPRFLEDARRRKRVANALRERPTIVLVPLTGGIVSGDEGASTGGRSCPSRALADVLEALRPRKTIDAVILRIDSPGGSAEASDEIWRAVKRLDEEVPVIASLGRVAASGGYYAACGARWIVAHPSSITGSIGVVTGKVHVAPLLDRLGIVAPSVASAPRAGMFEPDRPFTEDERAAVRREMFRVYDTFLDRASQARKKTKEEIDALGRGRVYTGKRALEVGLVDELGGLSTAIERARTIAGVSPGREHRLVSMRPRPRRSSALPLPLGVLDWLAPGASEWVPLLLRGGVLLWEPLSVEGV
ncbi:signal peptide peptidase SppA, partial [bacterium]|nr:signal peptide peptidase SppA [bacterium]